MNSELELAKLALRLKDLIAQSGTEAQAELGLLEEQLLAFGERLRKVERRPHGGGGAQGIQGEPGPPGPPGPIASSYFPNGW